MNDLQSSIIVILVCGAGVSLLLGFVWLVMMKWCAGCMVWLTLLSAIAALVIVTIVSYFKAGILTSSQFSSAVRGFVQPFVLCG
jgi:choline transporter-like protein 2/4/5